MSDLCPTLKALLDLGFEKRPAKYGMPTVGFSLIGLDLTASDGINRHFQPTVFLNGVLDVGRRIATIESEMPRDLVAPEAAAAWTSYALRSYDQDLLPLPAWMIEGKHYWDLIPFVRDARAFEDRPCCKIAREYARTLREKLREELSGRSTDLPVNFAFDGRVLTVKTNGNILEVVGAGKAWSSAYEVTMGADTKLPARFRSSIVEFSFYKGHLVFDSYRYAAREIEA